MHLFSFKENMSSTKNPLSRRTLFAGAGAAGAVAVAASLVPALPEAAAPPAVTDVTPPRGGGYRLSEHVRHYYQTTRI